jgi:hypothetical protein
MANLNIKLHTATAKFEEEFKMGSDSVRLIMDGYEFADGSYVVTAGLWNDTKAEWVRMGNKQYANTYEASEDYIKKFKLTY